MSKRIPFYLPEVDFTSTLRKRKSISADDENEDPSRPNYTTSKKLRSSSSNRRNDQSPNRWGSTAPALGMQSPALNGAASSTASKVADSGIESFYRYKSSEEKKSSFEPQIVGKSQENGKEDQEDLGKSTTLVYHPLPIVSTTMATPIKRSQPKSQPNELGGMANLLVADLNASSPFQVSSKGIDKKAAPASGRVAYIAGKLEDQMAKENNTAMKPSVKAPAASTIRDRKTTNKFSPVALCSTAQTSANFSSRNATIDTRSQPVSKQLKKWEKASQMGTALDPDDSLPECDALASTSIQAFQSRRNGP